MPALQALSHLASADRAARPVMCSAETGYLLDISPTRRQCPRSRPRVSPRRSPATPSRDCVLLLCLAVLVQTVAGWRPMTPPLRPRRVAQHDHRVEARRHGCSMGALDHHPERRLPGSFRLIQCERIRRERVPLDGSELYPAEITRYFNHLVAALGLPPIRLHDLPARRRYPSPRCRGRHQSRPISPGSLDNHPHTRHLHQRVPAASQRSRREGRKYGASDG